MCNIHWLVDINPVAINRVSIFAHDLPNFFASLSSQFRFVSPESAEIVRFSQVAKLNNLVWNFGLDLEPVHLFWS